MREEKEGEAGTDHLASVVVSLHVDLDLVDVADDLDVVRGLLTIPSVLCSNLNLPLVSNGDKAGGEKEPKRTRMNCTPCSAPSGIILVPYPSLVHHATISPVPTSSSAWRRRGGGEERGGEEGGPSMSPTVLPGSGGA